MNDMKNKIKALIDLVVIMVMVIVVVAGSSIATSATTVTKILEFDLNNYKNGTITDNTGHNITLSKVGDGEITIIDGKDGKAVWFNKAGLGAEKVLMNLGRQYTICATVKFPSYGTGCRLYGTGIYELGTGFECGPTADGKWLFCGAANDEEQFICFSDAAYSPNVTNIFDDNWHTVAMVVDLDKKYTRLFVDGQVQPILRWSNENVVISDDGTYAICDAEFTSLTTQAFALGCGGVGDDAYVDFGDFGMQDFIIYNKAFTENDFRRQMKIPTVEGGDNTDPIYTENESNVTIIKVDRKLAPNNMEMDSMHEASQYSAVSKGSNGNITEKNNSLLMISSITAGISLLILAASVILFITRKRRAVNVGKRT